MAIHHKSEFSKGDTVEFTETVTHVRRGIVDYVGSNGLDVDGSDGKLYSPSYSTTITVTKKAPLKVGHMLTSEADGKRASGGTIIQNGSSIFQKSHYEEKWLAMGDSYKYSNHDVFTYGPTGGYKALHVPAGA